ncbi:MAG: hypothetical protein HY996_12365 [Micrococcales bacterium]|nr:hypothetical protein [Micrococcales bacterium]
MAFRSDRPRLVVADSRDASDPHLRELLERAGAAYEIERVTTCSRALEAIAREPRAVLAQVDLDDRPDMPAVGPLLAGIVSRENGHVPLLLYASALGGGHERCLAQLGVRAPVVYERRLVAFFDEILPDLVSHHEAMGVLRAMPRPPEDAADDDLPQGFRIDRFLAEVDMAVLNASAREHADRTLAAAAVRVPVETFDVRRRQQALDRPGARRPASDAAPSLLWCSRNPPPEAIRDRCQRSDIGVRTVQPGSLHPQTMMSVAVIAAVVEPADPASAIDAWLLQRSVRPFLIAGAIPTPVKFLLGELNVFGPRVALRELPPQLLSAGLSAARLYCDEDLTLRLPFGRAGVPAWPTDAEELRRRLDARILRLAAATQQPSAKAAAALGLPDSTYRARLARAKRTDGAQATRRS